MARRWIKVSVSVTDAHAQMIETLKTAYGVTTKSGVIQNALEREWADYECGGVGAAAVAAEQARRTLAAHEAQQR